MKLLTQFKYCNGAVGIFRGGNILLNEIKLTVLSTKKKDFKIIIKVVIKNLISFIKRLRIFNKPNIEKYF